MASAIPTHYPYDQINRMNGSGRSNPFDSSCFVENIVWLSVFQQRLFLDIQNTRNPNFTGWCLWCVVLCKMYCH